MNNTFTKINMNIPYKLSSKRNNSTKMAKNNLLNREKNKDNLVFNVDLSNINKNHDNVYNKRQNQLSYNNLTQIETNPLSSSRSTGSISIAIANKRINDIKLTYALKTLNLENLYNDFNLNHITFNDLCLLTREDLIEMNLPIGTRNRLFHFTQEYKNYAKNYDINELINFFQSHKQFIINTINDFHSHLFQNKIEDSQYSQTYSNDSYDYTNYIKNNIKNSKDLEYNNNPNEEKQNYLNSIPLPKKKQNLNYWKIKKIETNNNKNNNLKIKNNNESSFVNKNLFENKKIKPTFYNINNENKSNKFSNSFSNINNVQNIRINQYNTIRRNNSIKYKNENKTNQPSLFKLNEKIFGIKKKRSFSNINNKGIEVLNNFQTLFSEIENFQKKYQNMKNESSKRKNYIKELLSKTNIHIK